MRIAKLLFILLSLLITLGGCEKKKPTTELRDVHWDRDMCERCKMVTSDRHHSVQVINPANGKSYMFDDIGCTLLWFDDEKIEWRDRAKIWITDSQTGKWIDAREAYYDSDSITPMAYGLSAHALRSDIKQDAEVLHFKDLHSIIIRIEEKINNRKPN